MAAFFEPLDEGRFLGTDNTVGPWNPAHQHAGPASALLARAVEGTSDRTHSMVTRFTAEILGPLPVGVPLDVSAEVVRPGRSVELVATSMSAAGREVMRGAAWRMRTEVLNLTPAPREPAPPFVDVADDRGFGDGLSGYLGAMEWRWVAGHFMAPGPATVWARMRIPLVPDEEPSPLQRVLALADSGNGISGVLDFGAWFFINTDLTVHLHRLPVGEWVCLQAATVVEQNGVGLAHSTLFDRDGAIGRGAQALLVGPR